MKRNKFIHLSYIIDKIILLIHLLQGYILQGVMEVVAVVLIYLVVEEVTAVAEEDFSIRDVVKNKYKLIKIIENINAFSMIF